MATSNLIFPVVLVLAVGFLLSKTIGLCSLLCCSLRYFWTLPAAFIGYLICRQWRYNKEELPDLKSKAVLITGCDSGFGQRLAVVLHGKGLTVYAGCLTEAGVEELKQLTRNSDKMRPVLIDITRQQDVQRVKELIENQLSDNLKFWGLVNNAGIAGINVVEICKVSDYRKVLEVNFFSHVSVIEAFLPLIKKSRGRVVTVSSIAGRVTLMPGPYTCSKHAMTAYMDGLRRSLIPFGVKAVTIEPGWTIGTRITNINTSVDDTQKVWDELPDDVKQELGPKFLEQFFHRARLLTSNFLVSLNKVETVVNAMAHAMCASNPRSRYTTGFDSYLVALPLQLLPDCVNDWLTTRRL